MARASSSAGTSKLTAPWRWLAPLLEHYAAAGALYTHDGAVPDEVLSLLRRAVELGVDGPFDRRVPRPPER
jgi:hypothetical protein